MTDKTINVAPETIISKELIKTLGLNTEEDEFDFKLLGEDGNFYSLTYLLKKHIEKMEEIKE